MQISRRPPPLSILMLIFAMAVPSWANPAPRRAPAPAQIFPVTATIQDLMEGQIDPAADALWDSVAYIASTSAIEDRRPRSDADWAAVRRQALILVAALFHSR